MLTMLYSLWFLRLVKPEWILSYYIPGLGFLKSVPTILLYALFAYVLLRESSKITIDKPFLLFLISIAISAVMAGNTGLARKALFGTMDNYIFYILNLSIISSREESGKILERIFKVYIFTFLLYGIAGIVYKGKVPFHVALSEEDAFGPFMDLGVPIALFLAFRYNRASLGHLFIAGLCVIGLIASFARGAFVGLCAVGLWIWAKSTNKIGMSAVLICMVVILLVASSVMFGGDAYWNEMATINQSVTDEKQEGRHWLRKKALELYSANPIIGVGPFNFGPALTKVVTMKESSERGMEREKYFLRVPHSVYNQILAELGTLGAVTFMILIGTFWRKNNQVQAYYKRMLSEAKENRTDHDDGQLDILRAASYSCLAVEGAMVTYLINGLFYDVLYYHWLVDLLILNSVIYSSLRKSFASPVVSQLSQPLPQLQAPSRAW